MKFDIAIVAYDEKGNVQQKLELENLSFIMALGVLVGFPRKKYASMAVTMATGQTEFGD